MIVIQKNENHICADGKFFRAILIDDQDQQPIYRQLELYAPGACGTYGEEIPVTIDRWLTALENGTLTPRWAVGSTGGQLTARYKVRPEDGELVSLLALAGGMR